VTAGDLVFTGLQTGELVAYDAENGEELWRYKTGSGIIAPPVTYEVDGAQYVAVVSGIGGVVAWNLPYTDLAQVNKGGSLTVFRLHKRRD
jgi:alcohol dehydrogenase (cytochrome c)